MYVACAQLANSGRLGVARRPSAHEVPQTLTR